MMAEQGRRLLDRLDQPRLGLIAERKLAGHSTPEITREPSCSQQRVELQMALIRGTWFATKDDDPS